MNKPDRHIFLWGMPGSGKSFWGKKLAAYLHLPFVDLDEWIVRAEGISISEIFSLRGEVGFREAEQRALHQILHALPEPSVIACGGGTPCFFDNCHVMKANGLTVYIHLPAEALVKRVGERTHKRPLLQQNPEQSIGDLLDKRSELYEQADLKISGINLKLSTFIEKIASCKKV